MYALLSQPVGNGTILLLHLATYNSYITAVVNNLVPVVLQYLFCINVLSVDHKSACVAVESVNNVSAALLARLEEVVVENRLHIERRMARCHRQDADILLYNYEPSVFIDNLYVATLELILSLVAADCNLVACLKLVVELSYHSSVHGNATTLQRCLPAWSGSRSRY